MASQAPQKTPGQQPSPIVINNALDPHKSTMIFLHGRGFSAENFHSSLLTAPAGGQDSLREALPHTRFVFPTAPLSRASKYRRMLMRQWYDGTGDWEPEALGGMQPSVDYVHALIRAEAAILGDTRRIVLAGFSQGCAMALTCLLLWDGDVLGAAVGLCGFLPIASHLAGIAKDPPQQDSGIEFEGENKMHDMSPLQRVACELGEEAQVGTMPGASLTSTPVYLGHGNADPEVDPTQAVKASELLRILGFEVCFHQYEGVTHWYSPDMLRDMVSFLQNRLAP